MSNKRGVVVQDDKEWGYAIRNHKDGDLAFNLTKVYAEAWTKMQKHKFESLEDSIVFRHLDMELTNQVFQLIKGDV
jgi:hypothetical protein